MPITENVAFAPLVLIGIVVMWVCQANLFCDQFCYLLLKKPKYLLTLFVQQEGS